MWEKAIENILNNKGGSVITVVACAGLYVLVNLPRLVKEGAEAGLKLLEFLKAWRAYRGDAGKQDNP